MPERRRTVPERAGDDAVIKRGDVRVLLLGCLTAGCSGGPGAGALVISEVMYHPVLEGAADDHEFVEIHNAGPGRVDLAGWKLHVDGKERYTFAAGTTIAPGQYRVVARNREALASLPTYRLRPEEILGDYRGELDNEGGELALLDAGGRTVDAIAYDDAWPWPVGADALGAGEGWLPPEQLPLESHRGMGRSLERRSFEVSGREARNWEASPLDGATPGRRNSVAGPPPAVVIALTATPENAGTPAGAGRPTAENAVSVKALLSPGPVSDLQVEYFVDLLDRDDEVPAALPMRQQSEGFLATLPALPDESIVRYRIRGRRAGVGFGTAETLSPRPSDPFAWHATFVAPREEPGPTYRLFIAPADWTTMWTNLSAFGASYPAPNYGCFVNPTWNARVPAVFVADGKVHDVRVRYQGGRSQRGSGPRIPAWAQAGPTLPAPLRVLSWNVSFPRYAPLGKRRQLLLKKSQQACPGVINAALGDLFWQAGIPSDRFDFVRVRVNGGYYDYMLDVDPLSEEVMQRYEGPAPAGDLFKADGWGRDEGPWGLSDFSRLEPHCGFTAWQRYATSYERRSNGWKEGPADPELAEIIRMIEGLQAAREMGDPAVRAFVEGAFDVDQLLTVFAMRNFLGVWDDGYHNYQLYKRRSDGRWLVLPLDFDHELGGDPNGQWPMYAHPPASSFFIGEAGNRSNRLPHINRIKDSVLRSFRTEFERKVLDLAGGVLSAENVLRAIDRADARFDRQHWRESPADKACDLDARVQAARTWITERHLVLRYLGVR
jgi:hypothetical protein